MQPKIGSVTLCDLRHTTKTPIPVLYTERLIPPAVTVLQRFGPQHLASGENNNPDVINDS